MRSPGSCRRRRTILAATLTLLATAIWVAVANPRAAALVQGVDDRWHDAMAALAWAPLIGLARTLAVVGSAWVAVPLGIGVALWLVHRRRWAALGVWAAAVVPAELVTFVGKAFYLRARPTDRLLEVSTASFPSGHATSAAVMGLTLVFLFVRPGPRRSGALVVAIGYALLMAWSRTYLRVHWLSDVSAGALLGAACSLWSTLLVPNEDFPECAARG